MAQNIPKITPTMLRELPNQTCSILNKLIEAVNELLSNDNH